MRPRGLATVASLAFLGTVLMLSSGCSLGRPSVAPKGFRVTSVGNDAAEVALDLDLVNSGQNEIELLHYDYTLRLDDGSSYTGRWAALLALPPETTTRATIPAIVPPTALRQGREWSLEGTLRYRDPQSVGRILYEFGIVRPQVGFQAEGRVSTASES
ncbi:MAG: hypothetical protein ACO3QC_08440 [Phycisphaerales bacterium]